MPETCRFHGASRRTGKPAFHLHRRYRKKANVAGRGAWDQVFGIGSRARRMSIWLKSASLEYELVLCTGYEGSETEQLRPKDRTPERDQGI